MSFGFTATITRDDAPAAKVLAAYAGPNGAGSSPRQHQEEHGTGREALDLVDAAAVAAEALVSMLGEHWTTAAINVSGHANPGHAARPGWANDHVNVSVMVSAYAGSAPEA